MRGNPVYRRERKVSSRSIRLPLIMLTFNGILAFVALLNMYSMSAQAQVTAEIQYSGFLELYVFVALIEFLMLFFIMPALTAGSISGERERKTLDLMLVTQMTPGEIVFGKLFSSMQSMVLLVISSFPVFFLVFVYGGIQIKDLGLLFLLYLVVALLSASFGICFSALCRRSAIATAMSYGFLGLLLVGTYAVNALIWSMVQMGAARYANQVGSMAFQVNSGGFFYLLLLNPALTFYQVISGQVGSREASSLLLKWFGNRVPNPVLNAWIPVSIGLQCLLAVVFLLVAVRAGDPMAGRKIKKKG